MSSHLSCAMPRPICWEPTAMDTGGFSADAAHQDSPARDALELGPSHRSPNGAWLKLCVPYQLLDHIRSLLRGTSSAREDSGGCRDT